MGGFGSKIIVDANVFQFILHCRYWLIRNEVRRIGNFATKDDNQNQKVSTFQILQQVTDMVSGFSTYTFSMNLIWEIIFWNKKLFRRTYIFRSVFEAWDSATQTWYMTKKNRQINVKAVSIIVTACIEFCAKITIAHNCHSFCQSTWSQKVWSRFLILKVENVGFLTTLFWHVISSTEKETVLQGQRTLWKREKLGHFSDNGF